MQRVALAREYHARERTGQYEMTDLQRNAVRAELVGEPGDAKRRMAEHAGGDSGLLDFRIAIHDAADPAQIDFERAHRPAADDNAGCGAVIGDGVEYFARVLQARVDDLDRRHDIFGGAQHVGQADAGAAQWFAEHEGQFDLDPRQAKILMRDARPVGDHHRVEEVAVVRLVDLRGALHRLRGQADLVADELCARRDFPARHLARDRVGVLHGDAWPSLGELYGLFTLFLRRHQSIGGFVAIGVGHHGG